MDIIGGYFLLFRFYLLAVYFWLLGPLFEYLDEFDILGETLDIFFCDFLDVSTIIALNRLPHHGEG